MYNLHYNRMTLELFDINKRESKFFNHIEISEEDKVNILIELNKKLKCYVNPDTSTFYFKEV